ncbi:MAG: hypothetical protein BAJALOKI3v1_40025 [Promethearchaeota archaeon]|jgi:sugar phosphate isomerase/epimerase|nr:MAG: hypothetical protein BAJALOKI3v1_40025 [Candidatus Lokiarchaeota archaeon]
MIPIGLQTVKHHSIKFSLEYTLEMKLSAFEIFFDGFLPRDIIPSFIDTLNDYRIREELLYTVHSPIIDIQDSNWSDEMKNSLNFAQKIKAKFLTVHAEPKMDRLVSKVQPFLKLCSKTYPKLRIGIENTPYTSCEKFNNLMMALREYPNVGITFDIGHAQLAQLNSKTEVKDPLAYLKKLKNPIFECHLHTNDGVHDNHLSTTDKKGIINIKEILSELIIHRDFNGPIIFEYFKENMNEDLHQLQGLLHNISK